MLQLVFSVIAAIAVVLVGRWIHQWRNPKCKGKLPPGSMGLPIIGESIQFFATHGLYDISPFVKTRMARYGQLFKTNLVGQNVVVSTDYDFNYSIFQQEDKSFVAWYSESFNTIFGDSSIVTTHGDGHKYLKNLILRILGPANLMHQPTRQIDLVTRTHLASWSNHHGPIDVKAASSKMLFEYFANKLIGYDESKTPEKLLENFEAFMRGLISFPLNIPGTAFHACLQGRKNMVKVIKKAFKERRESSKLSTRRDHHDDFLDCLIDEVSKKGSFLKEEFAIDLVLGLLFAGFETTSTAIALAMKFIADNPNVLHQLTKEHEAILENRDGKDGITWEEYKSMTFTHMVINETVRLANMVPALFRKVVKDVEINGYTIPAGWLVMVVPSVLHFDNNKYADALSFNPWRWEGKELHAGSKTFMAFGGGARLCLGADFAKLQMAIFFHHLVTKYRWSVTENHEVVRKPGIMFPKGMQVVITEKLKS